MRVLVIGLILVLACSIALADTPKVKIAYDSNGRPEYICKAAPGTNEDLTPTGFFQIKKITYDSAGRVTDIKWADGNENFDNSWTNKANLTYE